MCDHGIYSHSLFHVISVVMWSAVNFRANLYPHRLFTVREYPCKFDNCCSTQWRVIGTGHLEYTYRYRLYRISVQYITCELLEHIHVLWCPIDLSTSKDVDEDDEHLQYAPYDHITSNQHGWVPIAMPIKRVPYIINVVQRPRGYCVQCGQTPLQLVHYMSNVHYWNDDPICDSCCRRDETWPPPPALLKQTWTKEFLETVRTLYMLCRTDAMMLPIELVDCIVQSLIGMA